MYTIQAESHFDSAHFLKGYQGACANLHGHRWKIIAIQGANDLVTEGEKRAMVADFGDLKSALKAMVKPFDHKLILEEGSVGDLFLKALEQEGFTWVSIPVRPTAEAMAKWFFDKLSEEVEGLLEIQLYETPTNCATYRRPVCF